MTIRTAAAFVAVLTLPTVTGCGDGDAGPTATNATEVEEDPVDQNPSGDFPDIVEATATFDETSGTWTFAVTVSSPYDTPERYADGWRVLGPDGTVFGVHTLTHDHANEQPFTRRQSGVEIPDEVTEVTIEGRDQANGFGGGTVTIDLVGG